MNFKNFNLIGFLKFLAPIIFVGFIFVMIYLFIRLFIKKENHIRIFVLLSSLFIFTAYFLLFTNAGNKGYQELYQFIRKIYKLIVNYFIILSVNFVLQVESLFNCAIIAAFLVGLISLYKCIVNQIKLHSLVKQYTFSIKNIIIQKVKLVKKIYLHNFNDICSCVYNC